MSVEKQSSQLTAALSTAINRCERLFPRGRRRDDCIAEAERSCRRGSGAGGHAGGTGGGHAGGTGGGRDAGAVDRAPAVDAAADAGSPDVAGSGVCGADSPLDVWTAQTQAEYIRGISAVSPNDVWVNTQTQVQHWDGARWTVLLDTNGDEFFFEPIWAFGPSDAWLFGSRLRHWDGTTWKDVPLPSVLPPDGGALWGPAPNDLWFFSNSSPYLVFHWDGATWTDRTPPAEADQSTLEVNQMWGATDDDVWAVGTQIQNASGSQSHLGMQHWNGSGWDVFDPALGVEDSFGGVWGSAANDVWANSVEAMWHFDGVAWTQVQNVGVGVVRMWGSCAQDIWAGNLHFDGTSWKIQFLAPNINVFALSGTGPDDVWIGGALNDPGDHGVLFHRHPGDPAPACGNFRLDPGEQCDPPEATICDSSCQAIVICGNGVVDPGEQCDPPHSSPPFPGCDSSCQIPKCGNGVVDPGEQCDPPHLSQPFPACDFTCRIVPCGNGVLDPGEQCDPPTPFTCDGACQTIPACGNGRIDPGEQCDPPGINGSGLLCDADCQIPTCGNLTLDPGEQCDPPTPFTCDGACQTIPACGNGRIDPGEQCDPPGIHESGLICDADCQTPTCGNLIVDPGEQCDPPNVNGIGLLCDADCQRPTCGNGVLDPGETCDPPFQFPNGQLWCDSTCQRPTCGNGIIDPGEDCDPPETWQPGNVLGPLYCGNSCTFENACTDCHTRCDPMPVPFSQCAQQFCDDGVFSPCG